MDYYTLIELELIKEKKIQEYKRQQRELRYAQIMELYKKELSEILGNKLYTTKLETLEFIIRIKITNN